MDNEQPPPSEDPDLADVWPHLDETEKLRYHLAEGQQPETVREQVRRMYVERHTGT